MSTSPLSALRQTAVAGSFDFLEAINAAMDGIAVCDEYGVFQYVNPAHASLYGYDQPSQLLGQSWTMLYDSEERDRFEKMVLPEFLSRRSWRGEARGLKRDGTTFAQELSLSRIGHDRLVCVVRDISARKRAELANRLLAEVTAAAVEADSIKGITETCMNAILRILQEMEPTSRSGWTLAQAWLPSAAEDTVACAMHAEAPEMDYAGFREASMAIRMKRGEGLVGKAWQHKAPLWITDVDKHPGFLRRKQARRCALRTALMVPVLRDGRIAAVFEFFSVRHIEKNEALLATLDRLGKHLGLVYERLKSRVEIEEGVALIKATFDATNDGLLVVEPSGRIAMSNSRLLSMFGISEEVKATESYSRFLEYVASQVRDPRTLVEPGPGRIELRDGRVFERYCSPQLVGGKLMASVWSFRDCTQEAHESLERTGMLDAEIRLRTQAEDSQRSAQFLAHASSALEKSLDRDETLRTVAELAIPQLADWCVVDVRTEESSRFLRAASIGAEALLRYYNLKPDEDCGPGFVLRTGRAELHTEISDSLLRAIAIDDSAMAQLRKLGLTSYMCIPLRAHGEVIGSISLGWCRKERYRANELSLAEDFAQRAALSISNARLYQDAQQAIRARQEFISVASHELRTPLTALHGYIQLLLHAARNGSAPITPAQTINMAEAAHKQCLQLVSYINELLDLSRITARGIKIEAELTDFAEIAQDVVLRLKQSDSLETSDIRLATAGDCTGHWDRLRLEQVVTNLVTNATKYGLGKPVDVRIGTFADSVRLSVKDRGIGISRENLGRIFDRFERAVTNRNYQGTGLGLWIVKQIVDAHCGSIQVTSQPGVGSTFTIDLPKRQKG